MKNVLFVFLLPFLFSASCKKGVTPTPISVAEELPLATQDGKNTFGCLINGNVWVPYKTDFSRKLEVWYDPSYHLGTLRIIAERRKKDIDQSITIACDTLNKPGTYQIGKRPGRIYFDDLIKGCVYSDFDSSVQTSGILTVTKLDISNRIMSGTFEFIIFKSGCDTIKATQGRFDIKF